MRGAVALLVGGLVLSILGTATATDLVSLREVSHGVPVLGGLVLEMRLGMGTPLAHALEPASAVLGGGVMLAALLASPARAVRGLLPARA